MVHVTVTSAITLLCEVLLFHALIFGSVYIQINYLKLTRGLLVYGSLSFRMDSRPAPSDISNTSTQAELLRDYMWQV